MQMPHKGMQCTCYQLVLVEGWMVAPLNHKVALQLADLPEIKQKLESSALNSPPNLEPTDKDLLNKMIIVTHLLKIPALVALISR